MEERGLRLPRWIGDVEGRWDQTLLPKKHWNDDLAKPLLCVVLFKCKKVILMFGYV